MQSPDQTPRECRIFLEEFSVFRTSYRVFPSILDNNIVDLFGSISIRLGEVASSRKLG